MLPPLGIIFGLLVGFIAVQVWSDFDRAKVAIATEASALRAIGESITSPSASAYFAVSSITLVSGGCKNAGL